MDMHDLTRSLVQRNDSKIVMLVADGLGGLPLEPGGLTELETAKTPNLDALARRSVQGGSIPVKPGITPGSGPGHLGLFGYDPLQYVIGRGALEATGIGFELGHHDVAIRANFCTLDAKGHISDRREAASIATRAARWQFVCGRSRFPASKCLSNRSRNIASWSCFAGPGWVAAFTTPIRKPPAFRRYSPRPRDPAARRPPKWPPSSSSKLAYCSRMKRKPMG